jgi:predicted TIM-barrel fold metal-dependent hydrolase
MAARARDSERSRESWLDGRSTPRHQGATDRRGTDRDRRERLMDDRTPPSGMRIVDSHAHIFPFLGGASGYDSVATHMRYFQKDMCNSSHPVRRVADNALVEGQRLWDGVDPGPGGLLDVNFRVGRCGRLIWTSDGVDYYMQFQSPMLQAMESPPDFMVAQMDYAGVERMVLQNAHLYGRLNEYFGDALRTYPDRFIGLADLDESNAHTDREIARLADGVERLGLKGVYYTSGGLFTSSFRHHLDDLIFEPYWREIERLDLVVYWDIEAHPQPTRDDYLEQLRRFGRWRARHPDVRSVLVHGIGDMLLGQAGYDLPADILETCREPNVWLEVLFPIALGRVEEYPFLTAQARVRHMYDSFGPKKLLWGSDLPNVERYCTYGQSLDYVRRHCRFLANDEKQAILGGNLLSVLRLA